MLVTCAFLLIFLGINANLLPTWMFLNSIQLIMHTALLSTSMPSNLHYFLNHYLSILRMNPESLDLAMEVWLSESGLIDYELSNREGVYFNAVLGMCGYKHALSRNLLVVAGIFFTILFVILLLSLIDLITKRSSERRSSVYMCNFMIRFLYEFFLEICLSVFIHITSMQVMQSE